MLETTEAVAESNRAAIERSASSLDRAVEVVGASVAALDSAAGGLKEHTDRLEVLITMRLEVDGLKAAVEGLESESKAGRVGKSDLMWRVAVGVFAAAAAGLGTALVGVLLRGG
jgi:hypothetical protein